MGVKDNWKCHEKLLFSDRNRPARNWNEAWEKKFERDIVDTYSTPRVFWVQSDLPDLISYYMKGRLEKSSLLQDLSGAVCE